MSLHFADIAGHIVAADVQLRDGDTRPPVVFFPGVMTSPAIGNSLRAAVPHRSWIAVTLPGHAPGGFTTPRLPAINEESFTLPVESVLTAIVGDRPVVAVGWSLGGFAALALAAHRPRRIAAVASLAGLARGRVCGITGIMTQMARLPGIRSGVAMGLRLAARWAWLHRAVARSCTAAGRADAIPAATLDEMFVAYRRNDIASITAVLAAIPGFDITSAVGGITVPVWIASGDDDPIVPLAEAQALAAAIPHAKLTVYPQAGHMFFCEWQGVERDFAEWLDAVTP